ncbi:hypothetical protein, partial [Xylella fastidiosa]|uniref:hypothetical protein n=1 Tax=Xylella fastidiosa TaxID=2371 RepID=UPI001EEBC92B
MSALPPQGRGLDRVGERPPFGAALGPFALELLVPFGLFVGVVDPDQGRVVAQALVLQVHHAAVLFQEGD